MGFSEYLQGSATVSVTPDTPGNPFPSTLLISHSYHLGKIAGFYDLCSSFREETLL